jgi:hypothetical protein
LVARATGFSVTASDIAFPAVIITRAKLWRLSAKTIENMTTFSRSMRLSNVSTPTCTWQNWQTWYRGKVLRALEDLRDAVFNIREEPFFPHLLTCLFQTAWDVSSADKGVIVPTRSRFSRRPPALSSSQVLENFLMRVDRILAAQQALRELRIPLLRPRVVQRDALHSQAWPRKPVQVILTSPPYGCGIDYERAFRLQMRVCQDFVQKTPRSSMIGRRRYLSPQPDVLSDSFRSSQWFKRLCTTADGRLNMLLQYLDDMRSFLRKCSEHLSEKGRLCVVIGNPQMARQRIPLAKILVELAASVGFQLQAHPRSDRIPNRLQNFTPRSATGFISKEYLLVFGLK